MLSIKGREPYVRMQMWLKDPNNIEKLKQVHSDSSLTQRTLETIESNKIHLHEESSRLSDSASLSPAPHIRSPCALRTENLVEDTSDEKAISDSPNKRKLLKDHENGDDEATNDALIVKRQKLNTTNDSINPVSNEQQNVLNEAFSFEPNPNPIFIEYLSKHIKVDPAFLANWFQTQRLVSSKEAISPKHAIDPATITTESKSCT